MDNVHLVSQVISCSCQLPCLMTCNWGPCVSHLIGCYNIILDAGHPIRQKTVHLAHNTGGSREWYLPLLSSGEALVEDGITIAGAHVKGEIVRQDSQGWRQGQACCFITSYCH